MQFLTQNKPVIGIHQKADLKTFAKFTFKHLCRSLFLIKIKLFAKIVKGALTFYELFVGGGPYFVQYVFMWKNSFIRFSVFSLFSVYSVF